MIMKKYLSRNQLKRFNVDLQSLFSTVCDIEELRGLDLETSRPVALLYKTGCLTIKGYEDELYTMGIPDEEVKQGLLQSNRLIPRIMPFLSELKERK